jgi:hypothetical protein
MAKDCFLLAAWIRGLSHGGCSGNHSHTCLFGRSDRLGGFLCPGSRRWYKELEVFRADMAAPTLNQRPLLLLDRLGVIHLHEHWRN